jgi:hypothetical protein
MKYPMEVLDEEALHSVSGGQFLPGPPGRGEPRDPDDAPRTWGQIGREYVGACVQGAGQAMLFGGRPRNWRDGLLTAGMGCAMGAGMKLVDDVTGMISGTGAN